MAAGLSRHCQHRSLLAASGYTSVPGDTSMSGALQVALIANQCNCDWLLVHMAFSSRENESIVHEHTDTSGINRDTIHGLLLAQGQQISSSN